MNYRTSSRYEFRRHCEQAWTICWQRISFVAVLLLVGCANGDFGRIRPSLVKDDIHAWVGTEAPGRKGKPPSQFPLTDTERQLRDLAYPLIEPPYDRQRWYSLLSEYGVNSDANPPYPDRTAYAERLLTTPVRSQNARYSKLIDDIRNDAVRVDPFFSVARFVVIMDRKREQALVQFPASNVEAKGDARARVAENRAVIRWVNKSLRVRAASYRLALEQLAVAAPSPMAAEAERSLTLLHARIAAHHGVLETDIADASPPVPDPAISSYPK